MGLLHGKLSLAWLLWEHFVVGRSRTSGIWVTGESGPSRRFLHYLHLLAVSENRGIFLLIDCPVFEERLLVTIDLLLSTLFPTMPGKITEALYD